MSGTYTLLIALSESATIEIGALGTYDLEAGWYAYTGSAMGTGGFARVERHRELARGERDVQHWHVDYLLCHPKSSIEGVVKTSNVDVECTVAQAIDAESIPGFGASDCDCDSHLTYAPEQEELECSARSAHEGH